MPQSAMQLKELNPQLKDWDEQLLGMPEARPVLMIGVLPGEVPQPIILTGKDLEPKTIMNVLDVVVLQLKRQLAWDKVKEVFAPEE